MSYFNQFLSQWQAHLKQEMRANGLEYQESAEPEYDEVRTNTLVYLQSLRRLSPDLAGVNGEQRDSVAWRMLEQQLKGFARKADRGVLTLASKLHMNEEQIVIRLNFRYDPEQHIIYVS
ncbi:hypothetical protein ACFQ45_06365 [Rhodanobacter aciditrophus]|uniref:Uncharacterized protein n=1 Tax=Rhodanobacter aciditrophus TaxID=1623218 RepID=A0ABW4B0Q3_9GAMM